MQAGIVDEHVDRRAIQRFREMLDRILRGYVEGMELGLDLLQLRRVLWIAAAGDDAPAVCRILPGEFEP
jgi:hypothetical protein